jgi:hypothetical protein
MSSRLTSTSQPNQSRTTARVLGPAQPLWARVGATPRSNASKPNHAPKRSRFGTWRSKASAQMSLHNAVELPSPRKKPVAVPEVERRVGGAVS